MAALLKIFSTLLSSAVVSKRQFVQGNIFHKVIFPRKSETAIFDRLVSFLIHWNKVDGWSKELKRPRTLIMSLFKKIQPLSLLTVEKYNHDSFLFLGMDK